METLVKQSSVDGKQRTVVRVSTSYYYDGRSLVSKKSITTLKRKSTFDFINEECSCVGEDIAFSNFKNIHDVADGIYVLDICMYRTYDGEVEMDGVYLTPFDDKCNETEK